MTKEEFLQEFAKEKYMISCKKMLKGNNLYKDLYQDLYLYFFDSKEQKFKNIKCLECFIFKTLSNMIHSSTSPFHYKYRKHIDEKELIENFKYDDYNYLVDLQAHTASEYLSRLPFHDKKIFELWVNGKSKSQISKEKNISLYFIRDKINTIQENLKRELKVQEMKEIKILLVIRNQKTALQYHRQYVPHERLIRINPEFKIEVTHGEGEESLLDNMADVDLLNYSIVIFLRQISFFKDKMFSTCERLKRLGIKIILDIDDYWELPKEHKWHEMYVKKNIADVTIETIKKMDWITTTTGYFADKIKKYNSNVTVLPNCISPDEKQFEIRKIESQRLQFGWVGGVFHQPDIESIKYCFKKINAVYSQKEIKDKYQLLVGGFSCNKEYLEIENIFTSNYSFRNYDTTYYNYLKQCTPSMEHISFDKEYRRLWGKDIEHYGDLYNQIDVALVPLKDNVFNNCKSELKIVEAGWMKKAVICSNVTPYKEFIKHGVNGLLVSPSRNDIDWMVNIRKLTLNPSMVEDMAEALHETIKEKFDIDVHNKTRAELYKSLI